MRPRIRIEALIVETFSVVLGILLALGVNGWRERRAHDTSAREALRNIGAEIAANRSALAPQVGYHEAMRDSLHALLLAGRDRARAADPSSIAGWKGIAPTRLVDNAWQTATTTGVMQYIPYAVALRLSSCYGLQHAIDDAQRAYYAVVYAPSFAAAGNSAVASMGSYLADLSVSERELAAQYDSALVLLTNR